mmetsp:Transcript_28733/g.62662  ORF Transcript_28733/g.62662 Transcript_28733/m.62662 type:complete len:267 (-) Transcript_28733:258-1058(-)
MSDDCLGLLGLAVADTFDSLGIVRRIENGGSRHDGIAASVDHLVGVRGADAAVDLDPGVDALGLAHGLEVPDLVHLGLDETLAAESWVHGHDEHQVDLLEDVLDGREGRTGVQHHTSHAPKALDLVDGAVQVRRGRALAMHRDDVCACLGEVLHALLWLNNHQVAVQDSIRELLPERINHQRSDGNVRHEASVHHVHVDPVGACLQNVLHFLPQLGEICGENRRGDLNRLLAGSELLSSRVCGTQRHHSRPRRLRRVPASSTPECH